MGGTRTMAQVLIQPWLMGTNPVTVCSIQRCDADGGKFSMQDLHCFIRATIVISLSLFEAQPPAALFPGILTHPLTPYLSKITFFPPLPGTCRRGHWHPIEDAVVLVELAPVIRPLLPVEE